VSKVSIKQTIGRAFVVSAVLVTCVANADDGLQDVMREAGDTMLMMLPAMRTNDTSVLTPAAGQLSALFRKARPHFEEGSQATLAAVIPPLITVFFSRIFMQQVPASVLG